jgi:hypothetical protein
MAWNSDRVLPTCRVVVAGRCHGKNCNKMWSSKCHGTSIRLSKRMAHACHLRASENFQVDGGCNIGNRSTNRVPQIEQR